MAGPLTELPKLREDLRLLKAGPSHSGAPNWVIHDPAANKYFQLTFEMFQLLSLWNKSSSGLDLIQNVSKRFGRTPDPEEITGVLRIMSEGLLLQDEEGKSCIRLPHAKLRGTSAPSTAICFSKFL
jgi:putative peptide zinc metalloprotease protein